MSCLDLEQGLSFCGELLSTLRTCFSSLERCRGDLARDNALRRFHAIRLTELPTMWAALLVEMSLNSVCPLLLQSVNRRVFEQLMIEHYDSMAASSSNAVAVAPPLNAEEENALRYVSGYVALKLMRKYEKEEGNKAMQFMECLSNMAVEGEESSFYNYTKEWIALTDRGGLFHINDGAYQFFKAIELETRRILPSHLKDTSGSKDTLLEGIKLSDNVQFYWSMQSVDIDASDDGDELLQAIVKLWATIRGYSLTATWMEQYKRASQHSSSKKRALRKDLRQQPELS